MHQKIAKQLTISTINPASLKVEYAVRGKIVTLSNQIQHEIDMGASKNFTKVIRANIGDSQAVGQLPITFYRQVLAACVYPPLISQNIFSLDVNMRAKRLLQSMKGSVGCYTQSIGVDEIRKNVAEFIRERDDYPCDYNNIFLTNGASAGIKLMIYCLIKNVQGKLSGIMVPIPQYPLYSATISEYSGDMIKYHLNEEQNWQLDINECERSLEQSKSICNPRAMVVINPGNPTGQVLSYENMVNIVKFCHKYNLLLFADEVYQQNIHDENVKFYSFKKVVLDLGLNSTNFQLVSFNSASKGFHGECGLRGGYMELFGIDEDVKMQMIKLLSAQLCSSSCGQILVDMVVQPPSKFDSSYSLFVQEKDKIIQDLALKAKLMFEELNRIPMITCNRIQGAMYAFPRLYLPQSFLDEAINLKIHPDEHYCCLLLQHTGICVVPGSGFDQKHETYHFRTTILPSIDEIQMMMSHIRQFNQQIIKDYK